MRCHQCGREIFPTYCAIYQGFKFCRNNSEESTCLDEFRSKTAKSLRCDECGKETGITESPNVYGFVFCNPLNVPIEEECCQDIFERKLWEQAQASKKAKQKAASETTEISINQSELVAGVDYKIPSLTVRSMR